jgi:hypothetical protein
MANPIVRNFIAKKLFEKGGAIANRKAVDFSTNALETRLTNAGIDLNLIKSQSDLDQALAFVKQIEDQVFAKKFGDTLKKTDAEIIPITDPKKRLNPNEPIIGGTQDEKEMLQKSIDRNIKEATEKGDFTGIKNQLLRDPDILKEFIALKKFPTKVAEGEEAIPIAMKAKFDDEMGIKSVAPRDYSVEKLVSDFKKFGNATDKDIQMILSSGKSGQIPYVMDNYGMSYTDVINTLKRGEPLIEGMATGGRAGFRIGKKVVEKLVKPKKTLKSIEETGMIDISDPEIAAEFAKYMRQMDPDLDAKMQQIADDINQRIELKNLKKEKGRKENSEGGRIGLKVGSPSKRVFLKVMGGLAATIAAIKSGLIGAPKKEVAKQVIKETATDVSNAPPKYFFDLANKIKILGKESRVKPQERVNEYNYTGKNGDQYTLTEDITTGDMQITKDKTGIGTVDEKSFDTINDRTVMEYRAPKKDVDLEKRKTISEGAEYDEYRVEFDQDGTMADGDVISENIKKEIIEEASEIPERKIKRAGGGVAYMLGE